jgi:hypothetical protein
MTRILVNIGDNTGGGIQKWLLSSRDQPQKDIQHTMLNTTEVALSDKCLTWNFLHVC